MGDKRKMNVEWERWHLTTPQDMTQCLIELLGRGLDPDDDVVDVNRGCIKVMLSTDGMPVWHLELGTLQPMAPVEAYMGQVIVLLGSRLESLTVEQYVSYYGDTL